MTGVAPLGSFLGGAAFMGHVGWSPIASLRITASAERVIGQWATADCVSSGTLSCPDANPSYTWLGLGLEGHATPRRRLDLYAGAEIGAVSRNAWRLAVRSVVGFDLRIRTLAFGPFAGVIAASPDSVWNTNRNYAVTGGLRLLVIVGP